MNESDSAGDDARTDRDAPTAEQRCDLSEFQLRTLGVLAAKDKPVKGLAVLADLEDYYGGRINHGRLYPNLDTLAEMGLIEKSERDQRTNEYTLTDDGRTTMVQQATWLADRVQGVSVVPPKNGGADA